MSPELLKAREKQLARCNSPAQTRLTLEEWEDFPRSPSTGPYYRRALEMFGHKKLKSH